MAYQAHISSCCEWVTVKKLFSSPKTAFRKGCRFARIFHRNDSQLALAVKKKPSNCLDNRNDNLRYSNLSICPLSQSVKAVKSGQTTIFVWILTVQPNGDIFERHGDRQISILLYSNTNTNTSQTEPSIIIYRSYNPNKKPIKLIYLSAMKRFYLCTKVQSYELTCIDKRFWPLCLSLLLLRSLGNGTKNPLLHPKSWITEKQYKEHEMKMLSRKTRLIFGFTFMLFLFWCCCLLAVHSRLAIGNIVIVIRLTIVIIIVSSSLQLQLILYVCVRV